MTVADDELLVILARTGRERGLRLVGLDTVRRRVTYEYPDAEHGGQPAHRDQPWTE